MAHFHGSIAAVHLHGNGESQNGSIPNAPSAVAGDATGGATATLTLTDNTAGTASHRWQLRLVAGTWADAAGATNPSAPGVTSFAATGLTPATQYQIQARAESGGGNSAYVAAASTMWTDNTGSGGGDIPPPSTLPTATASPTGYYRRNARHILAGRVGGDGAELMLSIGKRRRK